jgi:hypothetical protein
MQEDVNISEEYLARGDLHNAFLIARDRGNSSAEYVISKNYFFL